MHFRRKSAGEYFQLKAVRLYQPESVLQERLAGGVEELAAYCNTLAWVGKEYFGRLGRDFGSMGILIAVGIKPGKRTRLWCEEVDGNITPHTWQVFVQLLEGAGKNVVPTVSDPVACALECLLGLGPSAGFPIGPDVWGQAARSAGRELSVPDDIFEIVFPD
jgi:hypothetical protein